MKGKSFEFPDKNKMDVAERHVTKVFYENIIKELPEQTTLYTYGFTKDKEFLDYLYYTKALVNILRCAGHVSFTELLEKLDNKIDKAVLKIK
jgi:hypothetical protein